MPGSVRQGPAPSCLSSAARDGAQTSVGDKPEACPQEALQVKRLRLSLLQNKMLRQRLKSARHQLRNIKDCAAETLHQDYEKGLYNETVVQQIEDEDTDASSDVVFGG